MKVPNIVHLRRFIENNVIIHYMDLFFYGLKAVLYGNRIVKDSLRIGVAAELSIYEHAVDILTETGTNKE